jgi:hypothetical protein
LRVAAVTPRAVAETRTERQRRGSGALVAFATVLAWLLAANMASYGSEMR